MKEPLILKHKAFLRFFNKLSAKKKKASIITNFKREHICCLSEIFKNFLKRKLPTPKKVIRQLKKYKIDIKKVARKKTALKDKIKILSSKRGGNIIGLLLPLALRLIGSLIPINSS